VLKLRFRVLDMSEVIYIPFDKKLYDDLVRFSDGAINPASLAVGQVENWIERGLGYGDGIEDWFAEMFHDDSMISLRSSHLSG
jgi:hypothetical protein